MACAITYLALVLCLVQLALSPCIRQPEIQSFSVGETFSKTLLTVPATLGIVGARCDVNGVSSPGAIWDAATANFTISNPTAEYDEAYVNCTVSVRNESEYSYCFTLEAANQEHNNNDQTGPNNTTTPFDDTNPTNSTGTENSTTPSNDTNPTNSESPKDIIIGVCVGGVLGTCIIILVVAIVLLKKKCCLKKKVSVVADEEQPPSPPPTTRPQPILSTPCQEQTGSEEAVQTTMRRSNRATHFERGNTSSEVNPIADSATQETLFGNSMGPGASDDQLPRPPIPASSTSPLSLEILRSDGKLDLAKTITTQNLGQADYLQFQLVADIPDVESHC